MWMTYPFTVGSFFKRSLASVTVAVLLLLAMASEACGRSDPITTCCLVSFTVEPTAAQLSVGDTLPVLISVAGDRGTASVRLRSTRSGVVRLDTVVPPGTPAILHAVAPGSDTIRFVVRLARDSMWGGIPVVVKSRP
jgi:hypothetical protein